MQIHAVQTGTVAIKTRQRQGQGHGNMRLIRTLLDRTWTEPLPIYAWVIEHPEGIIVIDTGETSRVAEPGYFPRWHPYYKLGVREWVEPAEEVGPRLRNLGIAPSDVRWLIMTHLHTDHAGGLHHFPETEILVARQEYALAAGFQGRVRGYLPNRWPAWFAPRLIDFEDKSFGPFPESYTLTEAGDVVLVPTIGHTGGHMSVILQDQDTSYFFAGDTSYTERLLLLQAVDGVAPDEQAARETLARILQYAQDVPTIYLPSHDPDSGARLMHRQTVAA